MATTENPPAIPKSVKSWLTSDRFRQQIALVLPKHLTAERFVRVALTALTRIPKLGECTPESVMRCMMTCSELGLEPDGRRYHLIPFWNSRLKAMECQGITDYKGLVELVRNNGDVSAIHADVVCEKDFFEYRNGEVNHTIDFKVDRGPMFAAYAVITFKDGGKHSEVMTRTEIDAIRKRSRAADNGPWVTDYNEMAKKTVFRRATKWITLSPEIAEALDKDGDAFAALNGAGAGLVDEPLPMGDPGGEYLPGADETKQLNGGQQQEQQKQEPRGTVTVDAGATSTTNGAKSATGLHTVQESLAEIVIQGGFDFDTFIRWAKETGNLTDGDSLASFADLPVDVCKRLTRAKIGLLRGLQMVKDGQPV